jgi:hypothetical protein
MMNASSAPVEAAAEYATPAAKALNKDILAIEALNRTAVGSGVGRAFIGGGCCVHLSIEYALQNNIAAAGGLVVVEVIDSENTVLAWGKLVPAHATYQIKENIITTNPGAQLVVVVHNVIARVRWCEVFSC